MNKRDFVYKVKNTNILWQNKDSNTVLITQDEIFGKRWVRREVKRKGGKSKDTIEKYLHSPMKGCILRSYKEVEKFVDMFNMFNMFNEYKSEDIVYTLLTYKSSIKNTNINSKYMI